MKFLRIDLFALRNEEWFQFFTEFRDVVYKYTSRRLDIETLFILFLTFYDHADEALEIIRKSLETELLNKADQKRDHTFRGFVDAVKSARNHFDPNKQLAAEQLFIIIDHYGNIARNAPNEETAALHNFIQEMIGKYAPQIAMLDFDEWIKELTNDNQAYEDLVKQRNIEIVSRTKYRMTTIRKQLQEVYRKIVERIESLIIVQGETDYAEFVNEMNGYIKRYSDVIAQRRGQRNAKKS
jgi:hypothetical protein